MTQKDRRFVECAAAVLVASGVLSCGPALPPQPAGIATATSALSEPTCGAALLDNPWYNGLPASSLLSNAITQNPEAIRKLTSRALSDALFDASKNPEMNLQLADANARDVMADLVSCALEPSARINYRVNYDDPLSRAEGEWAGEMGLCSQWSTGGPSPECLLVVSSCLFARTNRLHRRVPVRFAFPGLPLPRPRVGVTTTYTKSDGIEIEAFPRGWRPGYVGSCTPKQPFTLAISDPASCKHSSIRACKNIRGCVIYSDGWLGDKHAPCGDAGLTFTCPQTGFFSVMTTPDSAPVVHRGAEAGKYPAAEADVFPFLEGAFFGNLFDPDGLTRTRKVVLDGGKPRVIVQRRSDDEGDDAVPHRRIYACYSQVNDEEGVANLNWRICDKPGSRKCFPSPPKRCHFKDPELNQRNGYHCKWNARSGMYEECQADHATYPPMTVYLHAPCDLTESKCAGSLPTSAD